jgi:dsRNA-specific ribonuclease
MCISSISQRAKVAEKLGIDRCIKYDTRKGSQSARVLGKAVNAIVGATFIDSDDLATTLKVVIRLG